MRVISGQTIHADDLIEDADELMVDNCEVEIGARFRSPQVLFQYCHLHGFPARSAGDPWVIEITANMIRVTPGEERRVMRWLRRFGLMR